MKQAPLSKKTKEFEIQWGVKWTNFTTTIEASTPKEAYEKALKLKAHELDVTVRHDDIHSLDDLLDIAKDHRVQIHDEDGSEFHPDDEE